MKTQFLQLSLTVALGIPAAAVAQNTFPMNGSINVFDSAQLGIGHWTNTAANEGLNYVALSTFGGSMVRGNSINVGQFTIGAWTQGAPANGLFVAGNSWLDGNVGIGTAAPQAKLHVYGNATVSGRLSVLTLELTSDRNQKQDIRPISAAEVLARVATLPITTWAYTNSSDVRHLGPMAQDFKAAFNLGEDDKHIGAGDGIGVALAAIKGLNDVVEEKNVRISALETKLANLESRLNASVAVIEKLSEHFPRKQ